MTNIDKCVFCGKTKDQVPAFVVNDRDMAVCSLCIEDCLALFCEERRGITRFIIAVQNSDGKIEIMFPRQKEKIFLNSVTEGFLQAVGSWTKIFKYLPFVNDRRRQLAAIKSEVEKLRIQKAELKDQLKAIEAKLLLLLRKLKRLEGK